MPIDEFKLKDALRRAAEAAVVLHDDALVFDKLPDSPPPTFSVHAIGKLAASLQDAHDAIYEN